MNQYLIQQNTVLGEPRWEFRFSMHSDEMAIDYASRLFRNSPGKAACLSLLVWRITRDGQILPISDAVLVADLVLDQQPVRNKLEIPK